MKKRQIPVRFVLCIRNQGCDDLQLRKLYEVIPDDAAQSEGHLRVIDDSGEDYLYPADFFVAIELPKEVAKALIVSA